MCEMKFFNGGTNKNSAAYCESASAVLALFDPELFRDSKTRRGLHKNCRRRDCRGSEAYKRKREREKGVSTRCCKQKRDRKKARERDRDLSNLPPVSDNHRNFPSSLDTYISFFF